jgi:glutathione S-transferase
MSLWMKWRRGDDEALLGSPHAILARPLVLEEAGVPYERVRLDLSAGEQKSPAFRAINPMTKVPALTDGTLAVAESGAICAYVAEAHPEAGLAPPVGDPARGRYLQWLFFSPGCVEPAYLTKSANVQVRPEAAGFGEFDRVFDVLEGAVAKSPFLLGERFSAADVRHPARSRRRESGRPPAWPSPDSRQSGGPLPGNATLRRRRERL